MKNIFIANMGHKDFSWDKIGNIKKGREDLGEDMPVLVYRLMQYSIFDILCKEHGEDKANDYFRKAGYLSGSEFAKNTLNLDLAFNAFLENLHEVLLKEKIGILRMESYDDSSGRIVLTIEQDLDCSGLAITNESVCSYDEGFISGILGVYTKKKYKVREIDCWASGARVCRFEGIIYE